jgi:3-oxoacyl-[acyl-carrier protein] reductase
MVDATQAVLGPIDVLVNCAGIIQEKPFLETTEADWHRMIDTDLGSVFLTCRAVLPGMVARGSGVVINIASDLGILGRAEYAPYCAAKAGVMGGEGKSHSAEPVCRPRGDRCHRALSRQRPVALLLRPGAGPEWRLGDAMSAKRLSRHCWSPDRCTSSIGEPA